MNANARVIAVIDPDGGVTSAIDRAARFAAGLGAPLQLLDVVFDQFVENDEKAVQSLLKNRRKSLEALARYVAESVPSVSFKVCWGRSVAEETTAIASDGPVALVVKDTYDRSALKRTLLTDDDWELIRHCPSPLLLAENRKLPKQPRFLAAVDPGNKHDTSSTVDRAVLGTAQKLSDCLHGDLQILHVLDSELLTRILPDSAGTAAAGVSMALPATPLPPEETEALKKARLDELRRLVTECDLNPTDSSMVVGDPSESIIEQAVASQADFVILGAVTRGVIDRILVGSTAERILNRLPCDMIVIRPQQSA